MTVRIVAALAVLVSAYVHLYEWLNGFRDDNVMGPLFAVNVIAGVAIAVLLFTWKHWFVPFLVFGFGASTLGGFALATTSAGLFGTTRSGRAATSGPPPCPRPSRSSPGSSPSRMSTAARPRASTAPSPARATSIPSYGAVERHPRGPRRRGPHRCAPARPQRRRDVRPQGRRPVLLRPRGRHRPLWKSQRFPIRDARDSARTKLDLDALARRRPWATDRRAACSTWPGPRDAFVRHAPAAAASQSLRTAIRGPSVWRTSTEGMFFGQAAVAPLTCMVLPGQSVPRGDPLPPAVPGVHDQGVGAALVGGELIG